jgi:hypothetical protein
VPTLRHSLCFLRLYHIQGSIGSLSFAFVIEKHRTLPTTGAEDESGVLRPHEAIPIFVSKELQEVPVLGGLIETMASTSSQLPRRIVKVR